jgi:hypothetical protein
MTQEPYYPRLEDPQEYIRPSLGANYLHEYELPTAPELDPEEEEDD